jgi:hypothetical protein
MGKIKRSQGTVRVNLIDSRFGKLTVVDRVVHITKQGNEYYLWSCNCDCGKKKLASTYSLNSGKATMCKKCSKTISSSKRIKPDNLSLKKRIFKNYKHHAKARGLEFAIEFSYFMQLIMSACHYCGQEPLALRGEEVYYTTGVFKRNGIDRVNTNEGYKVDNVVPCCAGCNHAKLDSSEQEFYTLIKRIYQHQKLKGNIVE